MAIAVNPKKVFKYTLIEERKKPAEKQTVFMLKNLSSLELAKVEDSLSFSVTRDDAGEPSAGEVNVKGGSKTLSILHAGLVGWENFKDEKGKEVKFNKSEGYYKNLDYLKPAWRRELSDAITEQNSLTEEESKN